MVIKAIVFDFGGVIVDFDYTKFFNEVIVPSPLFKPDSFIFLEFWRQSDTYHQGKISNEEFFQQTCNLLQSCEIEPSRFFNAFNSVISHPNEDIVKLLKKIKETGTYRLIMLSNLNEAHWEFIQSQDWEFIEWFDCLVLSYREKVSKPDPKIFKTTIKRARCKPKEILYIDDGLNNVRVAKDLGINGIKFTSLEELERDLKALSILTD